MSSKSLKNLLSYLQEEKSRAQERIKQCQILLNDPGLLEDDSLAGVLRDPLESMRQNAEDDFGSILHLLTVVKKQSARVESSLQQANPPLAPTSPVQDLIASSKLKLKLGGDSSQDSQENLNEGHYEGVDEVDPLADEEALHAASFVQESTLLTAGKKLLAQNSSSSKITATASSEMETLHEEQDQDESRDSVPQLNNSKSGSSKIRISSNRKQRAEEDEDVSKLARSLPVVMPVRAAFPVGEGLDEFDDLSEDELGDCDPENREDMMYASIKNIARSLYTNRAPLGEIRPHRPEEIN